MSGFCEYLYSLVLVVVFGRLSCGTKVPAGCLTVDDVGVFGRWLHVNAISTQTCAYMCQYVATVESITSKTFQEEVIENTHARTC